ncbi:MAG TPA: MFS transporter, partial [Acidimicrobiales bacterium]|nr:MFS transporter [Acidimicrobiales bacterium]
PTGVADRRLFALRLTLLWLVGVNMRTVILAVAPVLPTIKHQLHLNEAEVGLITTLPVLLFGVGAIGGSVAVARIGPRRTLVIGLVLVAASSALRGVGGVTGLFTASVVLGLTIAVIQPVLPAVAQAWFDARVSLATAVYGNGFIIGEAAAASLTLPLLVPLVGGSWQEAVALWSILCMVAAALFLLPGTSVPAIGLAGKELRWSPGFGKAVTWRIGLLQGSGSTLYFGMNAYLPTELHAVGHGGLVSAALGALNLSQFLAAFVIGAFARRHASTRAVMAGCGVAGGIGIALIAFLPGPVGLVGAGIVGLASACCFVVSLALPPLAAPPEEVHQLAAGMLTIGYVTAFLLPLAGGLIWDATGQPRTAFIPGAIGAALMVVALGTRPRGAPAEADVFARL